MWPVRIAIILILTLSLTTDLPSASPALVFLLTPAPQIPNSSDPKFFVDVSHKAGIQATHRGSWEEWRRPKDFTEGYLAIGQAWGDYDNDGWVDLYVTGNLDPNILYHNNRDGTFSIAAASTSVSLPDKLSGGAVWADYDNDGWRDLYVLNHGANTLFHNHGGVGFRDVTAIAGVGDIGKGTSAAWGDYDNDGYLDLFVANWSCFPECDPLDFNLSRDRLYHNNGDGTFSDVSESLAYEKRLGSTFAVSFMDYDNDGDLDIYVVNDRLKNPIGNVLWRNDGADTNIRDCEAWCWTDVSAETGADIVLNGMGLAVGDYDNDSDLDFYVSTMAKPLPLLQNQGDGSFIDVAEKAGVAIGFTQTVGWGTAFFDYDNNGWLDLALVASKLQQVVDNEPEGMLFGYPNVLFHNNGDGTFTDVSEASWAVKPQSSMGLAYADYDNDGRVDFIVGNWNIGYTLYHNEGLAGAENNWLTVRLSGGGPINKDAIGARVYLTTSDGQTQMQEVKSGSSLGAGNDTALHFGLGATTIDEVMVVWPNGVKHTFTEVSANQIWHLKYRGKDIARPLSPIDVTRLVINLFTFLMRQF